VPTVPPSLPRFFRHQLGALDGECTAKGIRFGPGKASLLPTREWSKKPIPFPAAALDSRFFVLCPGGLHGPMIPPAENVQHRVALTRSRSGSSKVKKRSVKLGNRQNSNRERST